MSSIAALDESFEPSLAAPARALAAPVGAPATVISLPGQLRVAAKQSAQLGLGGDFFEVFQHADGRVSIVVADVCGSGLAAAELAAEIRPALHGALVRNESPSRVLAALNAGLLGVGGRDRFVTAVALRIDARLGTAELACAGHLGPFVRHGAAFAAPANDVSGVPLGLLSDETYGEATLELSPGDTLVLVTDGITDPLSSDADPLGAGALARRLGDLGGPRAGTAADAASLCHALLDDRVPTRDDATVLVLQLPGGDGLAVA
jgi:serine phosphatase RsbU (regulator of sigma subunit)